MKKTIVDPQKKARWQEQLIDVVTEVEELFELLELDPSLLPEAKQAAQQFDLRVPRRWIKKIAKGCLDDPLLQQVLPIGAELHDVPGFQHDPLAEIQFNPIPGLLHKYHGRVLLTVTSACGINCRYCFRRHFPYAENNTGRVGRERILNYLSQDSSIEEVIYSGGEPLLASDDYLTELTAEIRSISHIKRIRIHSRLPITLPERITADLLSGLTHSTGQTILIVHCNHAQELDTETQAAIAKIKAAGITVLNQAVLLKGVNDSIAAQVALNEALFAQGILPYYLHLLDKVAGSAHFDLPLKEAQKIHQGMQEMLPGYLVPRLVREIGGQHHKTWVNLSSF